MPEPKRDEKPEQASRNEENGQEHKKFLALHRHDEIRVPNRFVGIVSAYVGFVGIVIGFGVLAFYTGHKNTQEIIFFACIILLLPLFLLIPVSIFLYLRPIFKKNQQQNVTPEKQSLLDRFSRTFVGKFFFWLSNSRIGRMLMAASYIYEIFIAMLAFPRHPRYSLAAIIFCVASLLWLVLMIYVELGEKRLDRRIDLLWDTQKDMLDISKTLIAEIKTLDELVSVIVKGFNQHLTDIAGWLPLNQESHEATNTALQAVHKLVLALDDKVNLLKVPPSDPPSEGRRKTRK